MSINNLHKYKKAKVIVKDLENIVKAMNLSIQALSYFGKYIPVAESISVLQCNKTLLEIHLAKQKKIVDTKGRED